MDRSICIVTPTRGVRATADGPLLIQQHPDAWLAHQALAMPPMVGRVHRIPCIGKGVAEAYNLLVHAALDTGATYLVTLEDDIIPPGDALIRLQARLLRHPELAAVSALYWSRGEGSVPFLLGDPALGLDDFEPEAPPDADAEQLVRVNAIPFGCAMWRLDMFRQIPGPWFDDTVETHDIAWARVAGAVGSLFAVDCTIKAGHVDSRTGRIYGDPHA